MNRRIPHLSVTLAAAVLVVWACSDSGPSTPTPVPTTVVVTPNPVTLDALGLTAQLTASVRDQSGNPMTGQTVTWASSAATVASVNASSGLVTAEDNGTATITATSGSINGTASVTVGQVADQVQKTSGDAQTAGVTETLTDSLVAQINDSEGNPIEGVTVNFAASTGGGSVSPASATTGANGRAATEWTFGTLAGAHTVTATPSPGSGNAAFTATANADVADAIAVESGAGQTQQISSTLVTPIVVKVTDQHGNAVSGHTVDFSITSGGAGAGVSPTSDDTDSDGLATTNWTLGADRGAQGMQAAADLLGTPLTGSPLAIGATAVDSDPASVEVFVGDGQTGLIGFATNVRPAVLVKDMLGTPFPNAQVTFVASGDGTPVSEAVMTNSQGVAQVSNWVLESTAAANTLTATVTETGGPVTSNPLTFNASGVVSSYDIEIRPALGTTLSGSVLAAFNSAEAQWEQLIIGNLPSIPVTLPAASCGMDSLPAISETVDDLLIIAQVEPIDGPGMVLGSAGPCLIRTTGSLTILGVMRFDDADLAALDAAGQLDDVILHEMGHVIGVGTLWGTLGLLQDPSRPSSSGADTHFDGPIGRAEFDSLGGTAYVGGSKVPVENTAVAGQADAHWRENVLVTELMTPFLNGGVANPLSRLTPASLWDMGYQVNLARSDSYVVPAAPALAARASRIELVNDIWGGPIYAVDAGGRIVYRLK